MTADSQASTAEASRTPSRWTLPIVLVAQFVTPMAIAGTAIALPEISGSLGAQPTALQWVVNGFNVAFAIGVLAWGSVSDRIGFRPTFTLGAALFAGGSVASAASSSLLLLDASRVIAGIGAAAVLVGASSMLSTSFEDSARTKAFALFGTINGLGLASGPTISGLLVAGVGWRGVFLVQAAVLALAAVGSRALPRSTPSSPEGGQRPPILDLSLLRNREFLAMCLVPVAGSIGFVTLLTYLPSALSGIKSISPGAAGLTMLALTVPVLLAPSAVAKLMTNIHSVTVGSVVYTSLVALILGNIGILLLADDRSIIWIIVPMILLGLGFGLPIGLVDGHALAVVPAVRAGTAAGLLNFFRIGSEAIFVAAYAFVLSTVVGAHLAGAAAEDTAAGRPGQPDVYRTAFGTTVVGLVGLLLALTLAIALVRGTHSRPPEQERRRASHQRGIQ